MWGEDTPALTGREGEGRGGEGRGGEGRGDIVGREMTSLLRQGPLTGDPR